MMLFVYNELKLGPGKQYKERKKPIITSLPKKVGYFENKA